MTRKPSHDGDRPAAAVDARQGSLEDPGASGRPRRSGFVLARFLKPSLTDWIFVSMLGWLFFGAAGATSLLSDGDTGWHIRTGEYILATGDFPRHDLFAFTMEGRDWFAWEWLVL